jgi:hypothetical protein
MQAPYNQNVEIDLLPTSFGKCLGLQNSDSKQIDIRSDKKIPKREKNEAEIIDYISDNLPLYGKLKSDKRGFTYLDLENEYIYELLPFLETPGLAPPPYFSGIFTSGAHITAILNSELHTPLNLENFREEIPFSVTGCYFVEPENWHDIETLWYLTVDSPELSQIRNSLGLSSTIDNKHFYITFAVKKRFLSIHEILTHENQTLIIKDLF